MSPWDEDKAEKTLRGGGIDFTKSALPNATGVQYRLEEGVVVNVYNTGKAVVQGKGSELKTRVSELFGAPAPAPVKGKRNKVFIVYGHDEDALKTLELVIHGMDLDPIVLPRMPSKGQTLIEKIEENSDVDYACVLLTPDDEGHPAGKPELKKPRARQNVILELGIFLGKLSRGRVAILHKGSVERPSDIEGLIYIPFDSSVEEAALPLAKELNEAGFTIDLSKV